ncbi:5'-methylthioadenosine/adenosylhomocysteine nucleosidase [Mucilaginibacter sp. HMF5004]|nr:5'-methylthioadenosine/adenosylhomocysteine nucleosidase [Mucilaginibacter rivuli]
MLSVQYLFAQVSLPTVQGNYSGRAANQNITAVLGAFPAEVALIHSLIKEPKELVFQGIHFTEGMLNGRHIVLAQTGIGKVNAAITTTLLLDHFNPREVLFSGIAGGVNPKLLPGDLVIGTSVAYHDYGAITPDSMLRGPTKDPITLQDNPLYFPCSRPLIELAENVSKTVSFHIIGKRTPKVIEGVIVTGDVFVSSATATKQLYQKMKAEATEMEGASVGQTCWQQHVPFLVIRSLSDNASETAHEDVATFYKIAAENSANLVIAIVGKL